MKIFGYNILNYAIKLSKNFNVTIISSCFMSNSDIKVLNYYQNYSIFDLLLSGYIIFISNWNHYLLLSYQNTSLMINVYIYYQSTFIINSQLFIKILEQSAFYYII